MSKLIRLVVLLTAIAAPASAQTPGERARAAAQDLVSTVDTLATDVAAATARIAGLTAEVAALTSQNASQAAKLAEMGTQLAGKTAELSAQSAQLAARDAEVKKLKATIAELMNGQNPGVHVISVGCAATLAERATELQDALTNVVRPGEIRLTAGCDYDMKARGDRNGFRYAGRPGTGVVTLTTQGWTNKGTGHAGMVTPADLPRMAIVRGPRYSNFALAIDAGADAGHFKVFGVAFLSPSDSASDVEATGELIRIGKYGETDPANAPRNVEVRQAFLAGTERTGQKRGIAPMAHDVVITQSWFEDIFVNGQDSQAIGSWNGGWNVSITFNYLQAGTENIMIGGGPISGTTTAMMPTNWYIADNIMHKPRRWMPVVKDATTGAVIGGGDGRNRQVKNLFEIKFVTGAVIERNLMVGNWAAAQDGTAILMTMTTNGKCPQCAGLTDVIFRDNVVLDSPKGVNFQGYGYAADMLNADHLERVTLENNYFYLGGGASALQIGNVLGRHDISLIRNSIRSTGGTTWLKGFYGMAYLADNTTRVPGQPFAGLQIVGNVIGSNGTYGVTAPQGMHNGSGLSTFVNADLQVAGNAIGGAPARDLGNYNKLIAGGALNTSVPKAEILAALTRETCGQLAPGIGADCARLARVFALLGLLPEP